MNNDFTLNVTPVMAKAHDWEINDYYLASFLYKPFGMKNKIKHICLTAKGDKKEDAVKVIISDIEYEIDSLTEIKDKIKSAYKL